MWYFPMFLLFILSLIIVIGLALSSWRVLGFILLVGVEIPSDRDNRILNST